MLSHINPNPNLRSVHWQFVDVSSRNTETSGAHSFKVKLRLISLHLLSSNGPRTQGPRGTTKRKSHRNPAETNRWQETQCRSSLSHTDINGFKKDHKHSLSALSLLYYTFFKYGLCLKHEVVQTVQWSVSGLSMYHWMTFAHLQKKIGKITKLERGTDFPFFCKWIKLSKEKKYAVYLSQALGQMVATCIVV